MGKAVSVCSAAWLPVWCVEMHINILTHKIKTIHCITSCCTDVQTCFRWYFNCDTVTNFLGRLMVETFFLSSKIWTCCGVRLTIWRVGTLNTFVANVFMFEEITFRFRDVRGVSCCLCNCFTTCCAFWNNLYLFIVVGNFEFTIANKTSRSFTLSEALMADISAAISAFVKTLFVHFPACIVFSVWHIIS